MKNSEDVLKYLRNAAEQLEIPKSIEPKQMHKTLKQYEAQKTAKRQKKRRIYRNILAVAACLCVVLGIVASSSQWNKIEVQPESEAAALDETTLEGATIPETAEAGIEYPKVSYEDIYASMEKTWEEMNYDTRGEVPEEEILMDGVVAESGMEEPAAAEKQMNSAADFSSDDYGVTNVQTVGVDEGDIVKNDGRYLYQKIQVEKNGMSEWVIQIIDTQEGLKEVSRIEDVNGLIEFYVWEDTLIVIEEKYMEPDSAASAMKGMVACYDVAYFTNYYHEITFLDIKDRSNPKELKTFTLQGQYASSRIADGYFYGFSKYYAEPGNGSSDYDSYVPKIDGIRIQADRIYLPEESNATSYLVLAAIDLSDPTKFTDTTAIVSGGDFYYVSSENIFVADAHSAETAEGWSSNTTSLLKFSYGEGRFKLTAMGEIKGTLDSTFSMDEYEEHLRIVSTVSEYKREKITDDRTGEKIGYNTVEESQTNALYVLDKDLDVVGKIEGLANDEQIYSARFMGDTGYFVTFRQTDPLFTVDLTDPKNPKILSELKVSGFSEYLHIYGEDRLLGIGMEADEETGAQQGMKLSMFDVTDKSNVQEIAKYSMEAYDYSEALYNHHAVMINTEKNIFGFAAEGYENRQFIRKYFVFTYENDEFVQKIKVDAKDTDGYFSSVRGTYIGDIFYLLLGDGSVKSYDLDTGKQLESLEP